MWKKSKWKIGKLISFFFIFYFNIFLTFDKIKFNDLGKKLAFEINKVFSFNKKSFSFNYLTGDYSKMELWFFYFYAKLLKQC